MGHYKLGYYVVQRSILFFLTALKMPVLQQSLFLSSANFRFVISCSCYLFVSSLLALACLYYSCLCALCKEKGAFISPQNNAQKCHCNLHHTHVNIDIRSTIWQMLATKKAKVCQFI